MAGDDARRPPPWGGLDWLQVAVLAAGAVVYGRFLTTLYAVMPPLGDAAGHAVAAVMMSERLSLRWSQIAESLIFAGSSYPPLLYILSALLSVGPPTAEGLPRAVHAVVIGSLLLGWPLVRLRWGRASAWIWTLLQALSPWVIGYAGHYLLDLPLAATVGLGFVALLQARDFDRIGPGLLLAFVASAGMMLKWAWLLFLGPPLALCAGIALWRAGGSLRERLPSWSIVALLGVGGVGAVWWAAHYGPPPAAFTSPLTLAYCQVWWGCQIPAWILLVLAVLVPALRTTRGLLAAGAGVLALAAPWYLMAQRELWDRYGVEVGFLSERREPLAQFIVTNFRVFGSFFPFLDVILVVLLLSLPWVGRRVRFDVVLALLGMVAGFSVITLTLPYDPRYLLPMLGLMAGAVAAVVSVLPAAVRWVVAGVVLVAGVAVARPQGLPETGGDVRPEVEQRVSNPDVTWTVAFLGRSLEVTRVPPVVDFGGFYDAIHAIGAGCQGRCEVIVNSREDAWAQGRTFEAAGRLAGIQGADWEPLPRGNDPHLPSREKAASGLQSLLVIQPCSRSPGQNSDAAVMRTQAEQLTGTHAVTVGAYPMPLGCEMYVDRLVFE